MRDQESSQIGQMTPAPHYTANPGRCQITFQTQVAIWTEILSFCKKAAYHERKSLSKSRESQNQEIEIELVS